MRLSGAASIAVTGDPTAHTGALAEVRITRPALLSLEYQFFGESVDMGLNDEPHVTGGLQIRLVQRIEHFGEENLGLGSHRAKVVNQTIARHPQVYGVSPSTKSHSAGGQPIG
jgi:hypothetical protein